MSNMFELNCLVSDDDPGRIFTIEIPNNKTVGALKKAIKDGKEPVFNHIPADALTLWKVSVPVKELEENLHHFVKEKLSLPLSKLSTVFSDVPNEHLHVVVQCEPTDTRPSITSKLLELNCLVSGDGPSHIFTIEIANNKTVVALRDAIKAKKEHTFQYVDADAFALWKVSVPVNRELEENLLRHPGNEISSSPLRKLSTVFSDVSDECLHIVVRLTSECPSPVMPLDDRPLRRSEIKPPEEIDNLIEEFLDKCRPRMRALVSGADETSSESFLPRWEPKKDIDPHFREYIHDLYIPAVSDGQPSLLLHNLGVERKMDSGHTTRISDIFSFAKHTVLINTSGSGKTRLLLGGLCRRWGFYFVAAQDSAGIGSDDLHQIIEDFDTYQDYQQATNNSPSKHYVHTQETARRGLSQLLLARFLLLSLLVTEVQRGSPPYQWDRYRLLWVLLQAQPTSLFGKDFQVDVFTEFTRLLRPASQNDLVERIRQKYQELSFLLTDILNPNTLAQEQPPFFCVLDEAQITTRLRFGELVSEDNSSLHSMLQEIWLSWTSVLHPLQMRLIISGTGIDLQALQQTLASSVLKPESYQLCHDIGAFEDQKAQTDYIQQYIPADWSDKRWEEFLNRAWAWFRGRYRSTATLISIILQVGMQSPHRAIDAYMEAFTNFKLTDASDWVTEEPQLTFDLGTEINKLQFCKMSDMQSKTFSQIIYSQILHGSYSLGLLSVGERADFVQIGFARHKAGGVNTVLDEPLPILAALDWVNNHGRLSLSEHLRQDIGKHATRKNGFEGYFAFYIRKVFENPKKLDEIFAFRSDFVKLPWIHEEFELVTVVTKADGTPPHVSIVKPSCGPSPNVGYLADSGEDVLDWISKNRDQSTFCFPPESFGPDVLFYVRSKKSGKLLLVVVQCRNYVKVEKDGLITGVRTVTPAWFWKSKNTKHQTAAAAPPIKNDANDCAQLAIQTNQVWGNIPFGLDTGADFPVLRIFASWPGDAGLERTLPPPPTTEQKVTVVDNSDVDKHPLASLNLGNFNEVNTKLDSNWFRGDVGQREEVHIKRLAGEELIESPRRRKQARYSI